MMLALCFGALSVASCGDDKGDDKDGKKDDGLPEMTVCGCKDFEKKFLEEFDSGEISANELNKKYRPEKEACYKLKTDMGKEKFAEEFEACE